MNTNNIFTILLFNKINTILKCLMINHNINKLSTNYLWKIIIKKYYARYKKFDELCKNDRNIKNSYYKLFVVYFKSNQFMEKKHPWIDITSKTSGFADSIINMCTSQTMSFYYRGWYDIPKEIKKMKNLNSLVLADNNLIVISEFIFELDKLEDVVLKGNNLISINPNIDKLCNLTRLHISNNNLLYIPSELFNLKKLEILYISNNKLYEIPYYISNLVNLMMLEANNNMIHYLSPEIGKLEKLKYLRLQTNILERLPLTILNLHVLQIIDVSYNDNLHDIPIEIRNLISFRKFDKGNDNIPDEW